MLNHIEKIQFIPNKISYLLEQKAIYQQDDYRPKNVSYLSFEARCNIEIEKLKTASEFKEKQNEISQER